jgi:hypothetical protein
MPLIEFLTPEQEVLLSKCKENWRSLLLSTERIDRQRAEGALRAAYTLAGNPDPEFRFLNGPRELQDLLETYSTPDFLLQRGNPVPLCDNAFIKRLESQFTPDVWNHLVTQLHLEFELEGTLYSLSTSPISKLAHQTLSNAWEEGQTRRREELRQKFQGEFLIQLGDYAQQLAEASLQAWNEKIWQPLSHQPFMQPTVQRWEKLKQAGPYIWDLLLNLAFEGGFLYARIFYPCIDFCSSILEFSDADVRSWMTFRSVVRSCGFVVPFEKLCLVIERPTKILLDAEGRLHADNEPAVTFADGSEFYIEHGSVSS